MSELKVIVLVGSSSRSWEDAVRQVIAKASESVGKICCVDVVHQSARVDSGQISEYRATVHVTFELEDASLSEAAQRAVDT